MGEKEEDLGINYLESAFPQRPYSYDDAHFIAAATAKMEEVEATLYVTPAGLERYWTLLTVLAQAMDRQDRIELGKVGALEVGGDSEAFRQFQVTSALTFLIEIFRAEEANAQSRFAAGYSGQLHSKEDVSDLTSDEGILAAKRVLVEIASCPIIPHLFKEAFLRTRTIREDLKKLLEFCRNAGFEEGSPEVLLILLAKLELTLEGLMYRRIQSLIPKYLDSYPVRYLYEAQTSDGPKHPKRLFLERIVLGYGDFSEEMGRTDLYAKLYGTEFYRGVMACLEHSFKQVLAGLKLGKKSEQAALVLRAIAYMRTDAVPRWARPKNFLEGLYIPVVRDVQKRYFGQALQKIKNHYTSSPHLFPAAFWRHMEVDTK